MIDVQGGDELFAANCNLIAVGGNKKTTANCQSLLDSASLISPPACRPMALSCRTCPFCCVSSMQMCSLHSTSHSHCSTKAVFKEKKDCVEGVHQIQRGETRAESMETGKPGRVRNRFYQLARNTGYRQSSEVIFKRIGTTGYFEM